MPNSLRRSLISALSLAGILFVASRVLAADNGKPDAGQKPAPGEKRELLSEHKTVARLVSVQDRTCRGRTALCPDRCGHSGSFANFEIVAYLDYQKPGQYGDPKAANFMFQIEDNHKKPRIAAELAKKIADLKPGDYVLLDWRHDYVTKTEPGGGSTSSPERPVTKLERITKEVAENAAKGK